ncbi:MAG TPA: hypothetical protein ACQGQI_03275, partial [Xylella sp.]
TKQKTTGSGLNKVENRCSAINPLMEHKPMLSGPVKLICTSMPSDDDEVLHSSLIIKPFCY